MRIVRTAVVITACAVATVLTTGENIEAQRAAGPAQQAGTPGPRPGGGGGANFLERTRRLLYIGTPGDNGTDNQSGVVVLDADRNYTFVKRISYDLPASKMPGGKVSGIAASVPLNMLYVTQDGSMTAIDLATDKVAWRFDGEAQPVQRSRNGTSPTGCCERPWTLPDGKTLLVGSHYNSWWYYIDGATGKVLGRVDTPEANVAHNLTVTADGKTAMLASMSSPANKKAGLAILDVASKKILRYMTFTEMVRPLTMNHDGSLVYVNVNNLIGFEIGEPNTGKVLGRYELPGDDWKGKGYSHGIGMLPDQSEIWVADPVHNAWQVWDNPGEGRNPVYNPAKIVKPTAGVVHSWMTVSNDGKLAFLGDSSVIDTKTHKEIAVLKDEFGRRIVHTEKVLHLGFKNGKLVEGNNQFAVGDTAAFRARMAAGTSIR
jgi:hypothetical protein